MAKKISKKPVKKVKANAGKGVDPIQAIDPLTGKPVSQLQPLPGQESYNWRNFDDPVTLKRPVVDEPGYYMEMDPRQNIPVSEQTTREKPKKDFSGIPATGIGTALHLLNGLIPEDDPRNPVVRPQMIYNEHAGGTGSQAISNDGGSFGSALVNIAGTKAKNTVDLGQFALKAITGGIMNEGGEIGPGDKIKKVAPDQLAAANHRAKQFAIARNHINAEETHVGDQLPKVTFEGKQIPYGAPLPTVTPKYRPVPRDATTFHYDDKTKQAWFEDPRSGDLVPSNPLNINLPQFRTDRGGKVLNDGGSVTQGSELSLLEGSIKPLSENPFAGDTFEFIGPSHEKGGIDIVYGNKKVEVEGNEPAYIDNHGRLQILGNMKVPGSKKKFKAVAKEIAKAENKAIKQKDKANSIALGKDPKDPRDLLSINSAMLMSKGAELKSKSLADRKKQLTALQTAILQQAEEMGIDPNYIASGKKKAKWGATIAADGAEVGPGDPIKKFETIRANTLKELQKMYPGKKVQVIMHGDRDIKTQRGLKSTGASKTSVSLHNFGGAYDFTIKVDGKIIDKNSPGGLDLYKNTLHKQAAAEGLFTIGDWDPYHIGLVPEGKGAAFAELLKQYPELSDSKHFKASVKHLSDLVNNGEADPQEIAAYNQLKSQVPKVDYMKYISGNQKEMGAIKPMGAGQPWKAPENKRETEGIDYIKYYEDLQEEQRNTAGKKLVQIGENLVPVDDEGTVPTPAVEPAPVVPVPPIEDPIKLPVDPRFTKPTQDEINNPLEIRPIGKDKEGTPEAVKPVYEGEFNINDPERRVMDSNVERLSRTQILPELASLVTNRVDPVWMQQLSPEYLQPYEVSFQDRLNENNSTFRALEKMVGDNPAALSTLASQRYSANSAVLGEEFRTNQGIESDVINRNTALANDTEMKNLGLADQQYVRQETARSKTRTQNNVILNSLAAKEIQHKNSMQKLALYENLYNYRFVDTDNDGIDDMVDYQGPDQEFNFNGTAADPVKKKNTETVTRDAYGRVIKSQTKAEDIVPIEVRRTTQKKENGGSLTSFHNKLMKKFR